jgi:hypothetical protein
MPELAYSDVQGGYQWHSFRKVFSTVQLGSIIDTRVFAILDDCPGIVRTTQYVYTTTPSINKVLTILAIPN